jgi:hypothetical protein
VPRRQLVLCLMDVLGTLRSHESALRLLGARLWFLLPPCRHEPGALVHLIHSKVVSALRHAWLKHITPHVTDSPQPGLCSEDVLRAPFLPLLNPH